MCNKTLPNNETSNVDWLWLTESDTMQENWKRCTFYTNKALGFATGAMFVRETGQESHIDEACKFYLSVIVFFIFMYRLSLAEAFTIFKFWSCTYYININVTEWNFKI